MLYQHPSNPLYQYIIYPFNVPPLFQSLPNSMYTQLPQEYIYMYSPFNNNYNYNQQHPNTLNYHLQWNNLTQQQQQPQLKTSFDYTQTLTGDVQLQSVNTNDSNVMQQQNTISNTITVPMKKGIV